MSDDDVGDVKIVNCVDCSSEFAVAFPSRGPARRYCSACGARRLLENARRYQAKRRANLALINSKSLSSVVDNERRGGV